MVDVDRAVAALSQLRALGVQLAVDDYGTGHSSLAYLKRLPVTELKIDKSFITNVLDEERDAIIASSTIDLGRRLGMRVVAEGVENVATLDGLRAMGCHTVQGYLLSRPLPAERITSWLARQSVSGRPRLRAVS